MEIYHVLNRGVDKRIIVQDDLDRMRFIQGLYMYNDRNTLSRNARRKPVTRREIPKRDLLVKIHAFCLMDNHYHLLLSPAHEDMDEISLFMKKLNMGYSKYFNEKYKRSGALWQGAYKSIHIQNDNHFNYIPYYVHLNPLDGKFPEWRTGTVQDGKAAINFLQTYRWSSFMDYFGIPNYPSITYRALLTDILGSKSRQQTNINTIITDSYLSKWSSMIE